MAVPHWGGAPVKPMSVSRKLPPGTTTAITVAPSTVMTVASWPFPCRVIDLSIWTVEDHVPPAQSR